MTYRTDWDRGKQGRWLVPVREGIRCSIAVDLSGVLNRSWKLPVQYFTRSIYKIYKDGILVHVHLDQLGTRQIKDTSASSIPLLDDINIYLVVSQSLHQLLRQKF